MDIERKGGNCIVISTKKYSFVTDPHISKLGLKDQAGSATAEILTQPDFFAQGNEQTVVIDGPGEYEVQDCSIKGVAARIHSQPEDAKKDATIYRLDFDDYSMAILGHIQPKLSESDLEALGVVDILVLPVGGNGHSIEPKEAVSLVRAIDPKVVIPTHFEEEGVAYEVPQLPLDEFVKELGVQREVLPKLKVKVGSLPETLTVYEITRTK